MVSMNHNQIVEVIANYTWRYPSARREFLTTSLGVSLKEWYGGTLLLITDLNSINLSVWGITLHLSARRQSEFAHYILIVWSLNGGGVPIWLWSIRMMTNLSWIVEAVESVTSCYQSPSGHLGSVTSFDTSCKERDGEVFSWFWSVLVLAVLAFPL